MQPVGRWYANTASAAVFATRPPTDSDPVSQVSSLMATKKAKGSSSRSKRKRTTEEAPPADTDTENDDVLSDTDYMNALPQIMASSPVPNGENEAEQVDAAIPAVFAPLGRDDINLDAEEWNESEEVDDPDFHLLEFFAQTPQEYVENDSFKQLKSFHQMNITRMSWINYAKGMQEIYNNHIRNFMFRINPQTGKEEMYRGPCWPKRNIYLYIKEKFVAKDVITYDVVKDALHIMKHIMQKAVLKNVDTGQSEVDPKMAKLWKEYAKDLRPWVADLDVIRSKSTLFDLNSV